MFFSVIVISTRIGVNFFNSSGDFFVIQFRPFQIIVISYVNTGSSLVALAIDVTPILSINGVVCSVYSRLFRSLVLFCSVSGISSKGFL